ncbi:hypothetical protein Tco_1393169 [Tanacetum coccineum]
MTRDAMHKPLPGPSTVERLCLKTPRRLHSFLLTFSTPELVDIERWHSAPPRSLKLKVHNDVRQKRSSINLVKTLNIRVNSFTMKMEILLEPTSNKLMVEHAEFDESDTHVLERLNTSAGNPVKEILLKLNLPDHRILKDGGEGT